ncbi:hypothetical protein HDU96_010788, partial [Phlyctochytrium bullatum]
PWQNPSTASPTASSSSSSFLAARCATVTGHTYSIAPAPASGDNGSASACGGAGNDISGKGISGSGLQSNGATAGAAGRAIDPTAAVWVVYRAPSGATDEMFMTLISDVVDTIDKCFCFLVQIG